MQYNGFAPWPHYDTDEIAVATRVLESGKVNYWSGNEGIAFEREFADYIGVSHAVAVANGTVALDLALHALGIGKGDEVVVTPRTFIASVSCIINAGALPIFADVDSNSGNITAESVRTVLTSKTRAIIAVHLAGWPCDMGSLTALAKERGLFMIEDCAQAHGATWRGERVGSFGHIAAFSFCTDKIMSTGGEGGMVVTNDRNLWQRMWSYKDHGKDWQLTHNSVHPPGFRWLHASFGTNWRLTEFQSAIGRLQLKKLDEWNLKRKENALRLSEGLCKQKGLRVPVPEVHVGHAWYKFYAYVRPEYLKDGWSRDRIMQTVEKKGIPCLQGICPEVYLEKAFDDNGMRPAVPLPVARELGKTSLMFLVHPTLGKMEIEETVKVVREVMSQAVSDY